MNNMEYYDLVRWEYDGGPFQNIDQIPRMVMIGIREVHTKLGYGKNLRIFNQRRYAGDIYQLVTVSEMDKEANETAWCREGSGERMKRRNELG